jgi:hypothetical protein
LGLFLSRINLVIVLKMPKAAQFVCLEATKTLNCTRCTMYHAKYTDKLTTDMTVLTDVSPPHACSNSVAATQTSSGAEWLVSEVSSTSCIFRVPV